MEEDSAGSTPAKVGGKFRRKKNREALLGEYDEWVAKSAAIEEYIAGKRNLTDNELGQHANNAFREAYGMEDRQKGQFSNDI